MVAGAIAGNISAEATTPTGNTFAEAMRGIDQKTRLLGDLQLHRNHIGLMCLPIN
jgi:hypothetical protein